VKRLSPFEKRTILYQYRLGKSLREIATELGRRKSTIYYHTRKHFGRRIFPLTIDDKPTAELGEFLGIFASDGCFYVDSKRCHYTLIITLSRYQTEYARAVSEMFWHIFGRKARIEVRDRTVSVVARGKEILPFLRRYLWWRGRRSHTIKLSEFALGMNKGFLGGIIRGLVAGDGSIYVPKRRIAFGVVSKRLAEQYEEILTRLGIESNMYSVRYIGKKTLHHVHITNRENIRRFYLRIGLTDPHKRSQLRLIVRR
jgi:intein/homing endonuclease